MNGDSTRLSRTLRENCHPDERRGGIRERGKFMRRTRLRARDRSAILDLLARWAHEVDTGDLTRYETLFTENAQIDFSAIGSPGRTPAEHCAYLNRDSRPRVLSQQHLLGSTEFLSCERRRTCTRTMCLASVVLADGSFNQVAVVYEDVLEKRGKSWLIAERICRHAFSYPATFLERKHRS